ncbi:MAG TPA: ferrochelatase [Limnochordales bacterium]|nr:ferrochelatase [Limnochordales bacterium]
MSTERIGILLMAYGTPEHPDEVEPYLTHIREHYTYIPGDKRPSPEMVADLQARYRLIGGRSPLLAITRQQAAALEVRLNGRGANGAAGDVEFRTYVGMKHWHPFIHDVVAQMAADGIRRAVGIALTPQYSRLSVGGYIQAAREAIAQAGVPLEMTFVEHWHDRPSFLDALARRVEAARTLFPEERRAQVPVVYTAHSLPAKILEWNDPYPRHMEETARGVSERAGVQRWAVAWQSAGATPVKWLEPELPDVLAQLRDEGYRSVLICPAGFVADHLEVLYDIDIEAREEAAAMGLQLERTASFNADGDLIDVLAELVLEQVASAAR